MTTQVTITGTGTPSIAAGRAGAGALIEHGDVALQFDAGRATALRLIEAGCHPATLDATFITHHHSDHIIGLVDLVFTAWTNRPDSTNLDFIAPLGPSTRFLERMLDPYDEDLAIRVEHTGRDYPAPRITGFEATADPTVVWSHGDMRVLARLVHHHPVEPAVAYRVETPDGSVVISGDTRVCDEVEEFASGCNVLVHEAFRVNDFVVRTGDPTARTIGEYHADTIALGAMAERASPNLLMVTHMVPSPRNDEETQAYVDEIRAGGYQGELMICNDLDHVEFGSDQ